MLLRRGRSHLSANRSNAPLAVALSDALSPGGFLPFCCLHSFRESLTHILVDALTLCGFAAFRNLGLDRSDFVLFFVWFLILTKTLTDRNEEFPVGVLILCVRVEP